MAECNNCEPCLPVYSEEGCELSIPMSCSPYTGADIECLDISKDNKDTAETALLKVAAVICDFTNGGDDKLVRISSTDTTSGYLQGKLTQGNNITLTKNNSGGNESISISAVVPTIQSPDVLITSTDNTVSYVQTGIKGHTVDLKVKIKSGSNAITSDGTTGIYVAPPDYKVKVNETDTPAYLIDQIILAQDPSGIVVPQILSVIGGKVSIGYTLNLDVLCASLNESGCLITAVPCDILISDLTTISNSSGDLAVSLVYTGTASSFRYIIDAFPAVEVGSNPFTVYGLSSGTHTISVQGKCVDGSYGLAYQELFDIPYADTICPVNISITPHQTSLDITWDVIGGATYIVELRTSPNGSSVQSANTSTNSQTFSGLTANTTYYVKVLAIQNGVTSTACPNTTILTEASPTCNAVVNGLVVTGMASDGSATATWTTTGVSSQYRIDSGSFTSGSSPLSLTSLSVGVHTIYVRGICANSIAGVASQYTFTIPSPTTTAYYGFKSTNAVLSPTDIQAGTPYVHTSGTGVSANYTANADPMYLWMAELSTEPLKTTWYASADNFGNIGTADDLYNAPSTSGSYRFYITNYLTSNTQDSILYRPAP